MDYNQERRRAWTMIFASLFPHVESNGAETDAEKTARLTTMAMEQWDKYFPNHEE